MSDFLRIRKQHDSIKFALILFAVAAYFLVSGVIQIVNCVGYLNKPTEYILNACSASSFLDIGIEKIYETEGVIAASFQSERTIISENGSMLSVCELSAEYLSRSYGIESVGSGKKIWMSPAAFDEFVGKTDKTSVRMSYTADDKKGSAEFIKCEELDYDASFSVSIGTTASLDGSNIVRVMFDGIDISGSNIKHFENLGYTVANREDILTEAHKMELFSSYIKHSIIAEVLSIIGGYAFLKIYKMESLQVTHNTRRGYYLHDPAYKTPDNCQPE